MKKLYTLESQMSMKLIVLLTFIGSIYETKVNAQTPQFDWVVNNNSSYYSRAQDVEIDQEGNIFYTGSFWGLTDFDPGPGIHLETCYFMSSLASFVVKLDSNKNFLWVKIFDNHYFIQHVKMKLDAQGNILLLGNTNNVNTDFDPDTAITENHSFTSFILKLDNNGNFVWVKGIESIIGTLTQCSFNDMDIDLLGNIVIDGVFRGGAIDYDFGAQIYGDTAATWESFIIKVDANANFVWAKNLGQASIYNSDDLTVDFNGNIYKTAKFDSDIDIDPDSAIFMLYGSGNYLLKLDAGGHFLWAKSFTNSIPYALTSALNGSIYITGRYTNTADFDPGVGMYELTAIDSSDIFISKLTENGNFVWAKSFGGAQNDRGAHITIDPYENVYLTGYFKSIVNFSTDTNAIICQSYGNTDLFFSKIDSNGNMKWTKSIGSSSLEAVLDIDYKNEAIYVVGTFTGIVDFDFGPALHQVQSFASHAHGETYVLKINQSISAFSSTDSISICDGDTLLLNSGYANGNLWNTADTTQFIQVTSNGFYSVSINNGAIISDTIYVYLIPSNLPAPSVSISTSNSIVCTGSEISILPSITNTTLPPNYLWSVNGTSTNSVDSIFNVNVNSYASIYCTIANPNVCSNLHHISSNIITVNTFPVPLVTFTSPQNNSLFCTTDPPFQITGGAPAGGIYSGSGVSNEIFTPGDAILYLNEIYYTFQDSNMCNTQAADTFFVDVCTELFNQEITNQISIYPNPSTDFIYINVVGSIEKNVTILDVTGNIIYCNKLTQNNSLINIQWLSNGMYFIIVENASNKHIGKFIKE